MPKVRLPVLINMLRRHCANLHVIYVECKSNTISDKIMAEIMYLEMMLAEMESVI